MGQRKKRIPCRIEGCESPIIHDRLMCRECWMQLPSGIRKKHMKIWRELRPFIRRSDNKCINKPEDAVHVMSLINAHKESMDECLNRANNIRTAKNIKPDNPVEIELKEIGLI